MRINYRKIAVLFLLSIWIGTSLGAPRDAVRAAQVPAGLRVEIFAEGIRNARSLDVAEDGTVAVGTSGNAVFLLRDADGDGIPEFKATIPGLRNPNGVAWLGTDLYIAETSRVLRASKPVQDIQSGNKVQLQIVIDNLPNSSHHGRRFIDFDPQGNLFIALGVPCNICEPPHPELNGTIRKYDLQNNIDTTYAYGLRNSVGFDWHVQTQQLWATDNGSDWLGDDLPHDELNLISAPGQHFGYPYCHQGDLADKEYGELRTCDEFIAPVYKLGPHVASLGLHFVTDTKLLPANSALVALHGSWNRSERIGYAVMQIQIDDTGTAVTSYEPFVSGWLTNDGDVIARPVDIAELPDGSILISDDSNGAVYRVSVRS